MHCILPCCMPDSCSKRYCDIFFSQSRLEIRFATASFTVKMAPPIQIFVSVGIPTHIFYRHFRKNIRRCTYKCCKKFKEINPNISLLFVTPYITEEYQRNRLRHLEGKYDAIIYPQIEDKPLRFAITYRNRWMIDKADCLICAISHTFGGAYKTFMYAKRKKKPIYNLAVGGIT